MPMNAEAMCAAIKKEYDGVTASIAWEKGERPPPLAYVQAFDRGLTDYVEANMEITYGWSGILPPPASTPDPVTSFKSELVIPDKTIGQPPNVSAWGPLIMDCLAKAVIKHQADFTAIQAGTLAIQTLVIQPPPGVYPGPLMGICTQIYAWLLQCTSPAALAGTHGPYSGSTTGMVIA
jgi:hypothetical protein